MTGIQIFQITEMKMRKFFVFVCLDAFFAMFSDALGLRKAAPPVEAKRLDGSKFFLAEQTAKVVTINDIDIVMTPLLQVKQNGGSFFTH